MRVRDEEAHIERRDHAGDHRDAFRRSGLSTRKCFAERPCWESARYAGSLALLNH